MDRPLVSIGMPVHNCANTVGMAIQSILDQTYTDWELILINDGSADRTDSICRSFSDSRIIYRSDNQNKGLHHRLNEAIKLSRGFYFARMDGDDVSFPERFERQVEYLLKHPKVDLLGTPVLLIDEGNNALGVRGHGMDQHGICRHPWRPFPLAHPTWMGKLSWFRKYLYSDTAVRVEDQEILLRSYLSSCFAMLDDPLLAYRSIDLTCARAFRSRRQYSAILMRQFIRQGNPMFFISSLMYGLLSIDGVYHLFQRYRRHPTSGTDSAPQAVLETWAGIVKHMKSSVLL